MQCFKSHNVSTKQCPFMIAIFGLVSFTIGSTLAGPKGSVGDLYICGGPDPRIIQVDSVTGAIVGDFANTNLSYPSDSRFGPNGNLFVVNWLYHAVNEFDGNTGAFIGIFITDHLSAPLGLRFEANDNLLVFNTNKGWHVNEFNTAGEFIGIAIDFVDGDFNALDFGPDGYLYVSEWRTNSIDRYAPDGTHMGTFASVHHPEGHAFGPNGNLYVCVGGTNRIIEFDGTTGEPVGTIRNKHMSGPLGIAFGPDGNIWVTDPSSTNEFDSITGAWIRQVAVGGVSIVTKPAPGLSDCLTLDVRNLVAGQRADFIVTGGNPGAQVAILWSNQNGQYIMDNGTWCANFGFYLPPLVGSHLVTKSRFDQNGEYTPRIKIPAGASGMNIRFQAAESDTCPNECMSNIWQGVVQ